MALSIMRIQRVSPPPCQHFVVTLDEDGSVRRLSLHRDDMDILLNSFEHGPKAALILAWLQRRLSQGTPLESLIGQVIA